MPQIPRIHHLTVRRTARYCTQGGGAGVRSVWYVLHGYRQLAERFIIRFAPLATPQRLIVAPEALNRFYLDDDDGLSAHGPDSPVGATWMTRHDRATEIGDYVAYLDELDRWLAQVDDVRRVVLGFSQGAATAARWAVFGRRRLDRLVLWGGVLPHDLPIEDHVARLRILAPTIVYGERDPALPAHRAQAEVERLAARDIEATVLTHPGAHAIDADALARLAATLDPPSE
ncbi:MAG TPA: hypothetical protein VMN78_05135 [Longimicrobiales bacterium]|nr:hypothetical protein [Longimicrobiales bacterium]